jgi:hypothetical protein
MVFEDRRFDSEAIHYNSSVTKKKIAKAFEDVLPVFVAREIIVAHMKVQKSEGS